MLSEKLSELFQPLPSPLALSGVELHRSITRVRALCCGCLADRPQGLADHQQHWLHEGRSQEVLVHPDDADFVLVQGRFGETLTLKRARGIMSDLC